MTIQTKVERCPDWDSFQTRQNLNLDQSFAKAFGAICSFRNFFFRFSMKEKMKLLHDLFFTDYGLMSFIGIVFMIGMGVFFLRLFLSGNATKT